MINAHKVIDYLMKHFDQEDMQIVLLLSQGALVMKKCQQAAMKNGLAKISGFDDDLQQKLEKIDAYLSDVIDEELEERNDRL